MTNDDCNINDQEHLMWQRLSCPALNYNTVRLDFYSDPFLALHNKKKSHVEDWNQELSFNLEVVILSEAAGRWAHWVTCTHSYPQKRFGSSYGCPKASLLFIMTHFVAVLSEIKCNAWDTDILPYWHINKDETSKGMILLRSGMAGQLQGKKQMVYISESSTTKLNYSNVKAVRAFINEHMEGKIPHDSP